MIPMEANELAFWQSRSVRGGKLPAPFEITDLLQLAKDVHHGYTPGTAQWCQLYGRAKRPVEASAALGPQHLSDASATAKIECRILDYASTPEQAARIAKIIAKDCDWTVSAGGRRVPLHSLRTVPTDVTNGSTYGPTIPDLIDAGHLAAPDFGQTPEDYAREFRRIWCAPMPGDVAMGSDSDPVSGHES